MITDANIRKVRTLAKGEVGLNIWSHLAVYPSGRTKTHQTGIFKNEMIPGLKKIVDVVHDEGGKISFQPGHAGTQTSQTVIGRKPLKPNTMSEEDIQETITAFSRAAHRAVEADVDAIQFHVAYGYLINQFLFPFDNRRKDNYGETAENRFQIFREIILNTREKIGG